MSTASAAIGAPRKAVFGTGIVGLLALALFINYIDRGNLSTAAPLIKDELKVSATQMGLLLSIFFWGYTPGMIFAGWLQERINAYRTLALGLALWSLATILSGVATGFVMLIVLRLLLGLGESVFFPCSSKLLGQHLPQNRMGAANALICVGLAIGPAFGTYAGGNIMAAVGWRWLFLLFGIGSALWLVPWLMATRNLSSESNAPAADDGAAPSFLAILSRRELWGVSIGHFCLNYGFYFILTWLPTYLIKARHLSVQDMAALGGLIYLAQGLSTMAAGYGSDWWMRRGATSNLVRKTVSIGSSLLMAAGFGLAVTDNTTLTITGLFLAATGVGANAPTLYAIGQTLAGPRASGKWMSVQNALGNCAGVVAPLVTGWLLDLTGGFTSTFGLACGAAVVGAFSFGVVVRKIQTLSWADQKA
ncbi:MAG TPA: MFS transporter [Caulobacteraceae bacterium]|jgi:MFS family permease|nr:MFS transporter [Caulobacteraceae bacterium]